MLQTQEHLKGKLIFTQDQSVTFRSYQLTYTMLAKKKKKNKAIPAGKYSCTGTVLLLPDDSCGDPHRVPGTSA